MLCQKFLRRDLVQSPNVVSDDEEYKELGSHPSNDNESSSDSNDEQEPSLERDLSDSDESGSESGSAVRILFL